MSDVDDGAAQHPVGCPPDRLKKMRIFRKLAAMTWKATTTVWAAAPRICRFWLSPGPSKAGSLTKPFIPSIELRWVF